MGTEHLQEGGTTTKKPHLGLLKLCALGQTPNPGFTGGTELQNWGKCKSHTRPFHDWLLLLTDKPLLWSSLRGKRR